MILITSLSLCLFPPAHRMLKGSTMASIGKRGDKWHVRICRKDILLSVNLLVCSRTPKHGQRTLNSSLSDVKHLGARPFSSLHSSTVISPSYPLRILNGAHQAFLRQSNACADVSFQPLLPQISSYRRFLQRHPKLVLICQARLCVSKCACVVSCD